MLRASKVKAGALFRSLLAVVGLQRLRDYAECVSLMEQNERRNAEVADIKRRMNVLLGFDHGFVGRDLWATKEVNVIDFINEMLGVDHFNRSLLDVYSANQKARDAWVNEKARRIAAGSKVLDVGAGPSPYRDLFNLCEFKTHDFMQYDGYMSGDEGKYASIDYVSDITAIPVPDGSFDVILCTEVLEHVPDPSAALKEMARIVRPGGTLLITAPLGSGLHQRPFHFYGGVTPDWYCHFASRYALDVAEISANGGLYKLLAELCTVLAAHIDDHANAHGKYKEVISVLFGAVLPRYLTDLDRRVKFEQYTIGYHVELTKRN
jgi:SAM-dependent methyltransferase